MLDVCHIFFKKLNATGVRYCHWKSNSHLEDALDGKTDLDLLIHLEDKEAFSNAANEQSFLSVLSPPNKIFPGIEDYLGCDDETGKLVHLHVHYCLILGQRFIKNHHLPIESLFLENRILQNGVFVPVPELELLVLVIRASMKTGLRDVAEQIIRDVLGKGGIAFPDAINRELDQLISLTKREKLLSLLAESGLPISQDTILNFVELFSARKLKFYDLISMHLTMLLKLRKFRRMGTAVAIPKYFHLWLASQTKLARWFPSQKKRLPENGFSVAVVGADGSGKSTLTNDLQKWLSWKLSTNLHYYGIPKTGIIKSFLLLIRISNAMKFGPLGSMFGIGLWLFIARSRHAVSERISLDTKKGKIAIIDRFPMPQFLSMHNPMDGPRLTGKRSWIGIFFSGIERSYYEKIKRPDLIIVLQSPVEILRQRKTDLDYDTHVAKATAVNALEASPRIILLDATRPYTDVLLTTKKNIWRHLLGGKSLLLRDNNNA